MSTRHLYPKLQSNDGGNEFAAYGTDSSVSIGTTDEQTGNAADRAPTNLAIGAVAAANMAFSDTSKHLVLNVGANSTLATDPGGVSTSTTSDMVLLDTGSGSNPSLTVNAANPADVILRVSGLQSGYAGTVTFTDSAGKSDAVPISGNGTYSANLSNLTDGTLTYLMKVSNAAGNVIAVDPTTTLGPPSLPSGVTLQQIDGGPTYYASNGFTNAASGTYNANYPEGWDSPNFFPMGPWDGEYFQASDATTYAALNWNTDFSTGDVNFQFVQQNKLYLIWNPTSTVDGTGPGPETVGILPADENYSQAVTQVQTVANSIQDNRFMWLQNTWNTLVPNASIAGTPMAQIMSQKITTPDGTQRGFNVLSADFYWFSGSKDGGMLAAGGAVYNLGKPMTVDQGARGSNYGDMIDLERSYMTANPGPIFSFIEVGEPGNSPTATAADYITPPELNWAVWSSLIHGARGITYFDNTFTGPAVSNNDVMDSYYQTVQPGQTVSIYTQIQNTDALVQQLAPVLNSQFALNYVTIKDNSPQDAGLPNYSYGSGVDLTQGGLEVMAKDYNGQFYIFADTRESETRTNIPATFTIADPNATSVTVVGENRTIPVVNGVFTDTFATAATVHIYEVNDGTPPPPSPTLNSIVESPASGDLGGGKTVTLTLLMGEAMTVSGGTPTLTLNDGGTATYTGGSGSSTLTFSYTVAAGQNTSSLAVTSVNLPAGTTISSNGTAAGLSLTGLTQTGPQIDTTVPAAPVISGDTVSGNTVTLNGTAQAGTTITVFDNSTQQGTTTTNSSGQWTLPTGALANGSQSFTATATDGAGNVSAASSPLNVTVNAPVGSTSVNLVTNGSFETDNFTGWTLGGNTTSAQMYINSQAESGSFAAALGSMGSDGTLSQTLQTTAGQQYTLSFWLANNGSSPDDFTAKWNGASVLALTSAPAQGYTEYTFTVTATGSTSTLEFDARQDPSHWSLDNISLTANGTSSTTAPAAPVIGTAAVNPNTDPTVTLTGTAPDGSTVSVSDGGSIALGTTTASSTGTWSFTTPNLPAGTYAFTATDTTSAGTSTTSSPFDLTVPPPSSPTVDSIAESPASGELNAGKTVTLTLNLSESVTVNTAGGTPTLTLNDGGTATYTSGSGSALTFSYTVGASDRNVASLSATTINLNGATITDGAGNTANLSLTGLTQPGPQIDTNAPVISSIAESPSSGDLNAGKTVTYTITMSGTVTVAGGKPKLMLNDGGTATYVSGSGTNALIFSYTVAAGQNTPDLEATAVNLNGATISDGAGNAANLSLTGIAQGSPQVDTTAPVAPAISNDVVSANVVTLTGTAEANSTVTLFNGATRLGTATVNGSGAWSFATSKLTWGNYSLTATDTDAAGNVSAASSPFKKSSFLTFGPATISTGATLELAAADYGTVTFLGSTGTLRLDHSSTFFGKISNFTGNGSLSGSDQIDLRDVKYGSVHDSYANGVLTVTDGKDTAKLKFNGSYTLANFKLASDGSGGTIVYDPPAPARNVPTSDTSGSPTIGNGTTLGVAADTGTVSGFGGRDVIDLPEIAFDAQTTLGNLANDNPAGGMLSVAEGTHSANIALLGNYMASSFVTASDNHGGTMVVAETPQAGDQSPLSNPPHTHT